MVVQIKLSASLRHRVAGYDPGSGFEMEIEPGKSVGEVLAALGLEPDQVKLIMVNGISASLDQTLQDGDRLGLFPAVGGG